MKVKSFHKIIDAELEEVLTKYKGDVELHRHKNDEQNKGYAFLIWFLEFYGQKSLYKNYITDGKDDKSCDIIFSNIDSQGQEIFYIIQSKWVQYSEKKKDSSYPVIKKEEFNAALTDFSTILSGTKQEGRNERFNKKHEELITHLEKNGKAKFLFFTLGAFNDEVEENIKAFNKDHAPNITLEVIDASKLKRDYIEFKFKKIKTSNPLEYHYDPEDGEIEIDITRFSTKRDFVEYEGREKGYIFLLKPYTVYKLFDKFKYSLFFKNVRNPLPESNYNKNIVETLKKKPNAFWYFNNGITAITKVIPDIGEHAKSVKLTGLQVINGAQTVYSIYKTYEEASDLERKIMDSDVRITLRLIRSSDEEFNLDITRFTNSQNPMHERDFVANDPIQKRLQLESFDTDFWYETRRGEFHEVGKLKNSILVIPNETFVEAYLAFHLQRPLDSIINKDKFFISHKQDKDGLYERIFNDATQFEDMHASFLMWRLILSISDEDLPNLLELVLNVFIFSLAFSRVILSQYLRLKYPESNNPINLNKFIITSFSGKNESFKTIYKLLVFSINKIFVCCVGKEQQFSDEKLFKFIESQVSYDTLKQEFEESDFTIEDIDNYKPKNINSLFK
ncbi:MAG: Unknown protein [uncultured Sulfurovum sp.]|uniref:Abortive phage infection protein C-terminal domain-containing protein n=1 Tax=uncultured Sulfurovum sp. TaxID=269237 RepID=A0A6S6UFK6_9BACT|nr:MAG: Unknown protein [uncultured Sulfurovum sp.]